MFVVCFSNGANLFAVNGLEFLEPSKTASGDSNHKPFSGDMSATNTKRSSSDKMETNALEFIDAVESLPSIEDIVLTNDDDLIADRNSRHARMKVISNIYRFGWFKNVN